MDLGPDALPDDLDALKAALAHARLLTQEALAGKEAAVAQAAVAAAELAVARARASEDLALIASRSCGSPSWSGRSTASDRNAAPG